MLNPGEIITLFCNFQVQAKAIFWFFKIKNFGNHWPGTVSVYTVCIGTVSGSGKSQALIAGDWNFGNHWPDTVTVHTQYELVYILTRIIGRKMILETDRI